MQQGKQKDGTATILNLYIPLLQFSNVVGVCNAGLNAGVFAFGNNTGDAFGGSSFRVVLVP